MMHTGSEDADLVTMNRAELRVARESLGLPQSWLAEHLAVSERTVRHWEQGKFAVPLHAAQALRQACADADALVSAEIVALEGDVIRTFASDTAFREAHPDCPYPASWHRAVVARVCLQVPNLTVRYVGE
jgi:DNA-binding XRE family transcriptional regulator